MPPQRNATTLREQQNWLIHMQYIRQEYDDALKTIDQQLKDCSGMAEYPIYVKALIKRQRGEINDSLQLFQAATGLNPHNIANLKQVGRSLYLLARRAALDVYEEALRIGVDDWEIWHNKGLCNMYLKQYEQSAECFKRANSIQRHDTTYMQLGKVYTLQEDYRTAIEVYLEALEFSPENPELLTTVGLLYLRLGENYKAFDFLGNSLTHDPRNPKTILAAGSIIQDHSDMDVALVKYRVAAVQTPNSAQLWNNIGMCFFGKQRFVAAIACLKRALYLDPFEWIISYNLGLVRKQHAQQHRSSTITVTRLTPSLLLLHPHRYTSTRANTPPPSTTSRRQSTSSPTSHQATCTWRSRSTGWTTLTMRAKRTRRRSRWRRTIYSTSTTRLP